MSFKVFVETSWQPTQATSDDYSILPIAADWVEDHPEQFAIWFQMFKNVVIEFSKKADELHDQLSKHRVDEEEHDVLEAMDAWLNNHMIEGINKVLNNKTGNGSLFSAANAIKNNYDYLSRFLQYTDHYESPDEESRASVDAINQGISKLLKEYIKFLQVVTPLFLRVAKLMWNPGKGKKNSFERFSSVTQITSN